MGLRHGLVNSTVCPVLMVSLQHRARWEHWPQRAPSSSMELTGAQTHQGTVTDTQTDGRTTLTTG